MDQTRIFVNENLSIAQRIVQIQESLGIIKQEKLSDDEKDFEDFKENLENDRNIQTIQGTFHDKETKSVLSTTANPKNIKSSQKFSKKSQKLLQCDFDGKFYTSKFKLRNHMRLHLPLIKCKICDLMLKPIYMSYHLKSIHAESKDFKCNICTKTFTTRDRLQDHKTSHNKKFECKYCGRKIRKASDLKRHEQEYHINPGSYKCEICGSKFNRKVILKEHQKLHDKNHQKRFKCQFCDHSTDSKFYFNQHERRHQ